MLYYGRMLSLIVLPLLSSPFSLLLFTVYSYPAHTLADALTYCYTRLVLRDLGGLDAQVTISVYDYDADGTHDL